MKHDVKNNEKWYKRDFDNWGKLYFNLWSFHIQMTVTITGGVLTALVPDSCAGSHWEKGSGFCTSTRVWWCWVSGPDRAGTEGGALETRLENWILRAARQTEHRHRTRCKQEGQIMWRRESDEDKKGNKEQKRGRTEVC